MPAYPLVIIIATASLLGALVGCLTGLVPGLHSNNAASFIGNNPGFLLMVAGLGVLSTDDPTWALVASSAVVACAVAHTVANIVPSIYLAIPEGDTALSVLPGHRMVMAGRGEEALRVSVTSSIASLALALALVVPLAYVMGPHIGLYGLAMTLMGPFLLGASAYMMLKESEKGQGSDRLGGWRGTAAALVVFCASGALGHLALFQAGLVVPLFIGLFGVPMIVLALQRREEVPEPGPPLTVRNVPPPPWGSVLLGSLAGSLVGWFPGISSAQATILAVPGGSHGDDDMEGARRFIAGVSAVNTANAIFTLVALATILRVRSGATAAVRDLMAWEVAPWSSGIAPGPDIVSLLISATVGGLIAAPITILVGRRMEKALPVLSAKWFLAMVLAVLVFMAIVTGGFTAVIVLITASGLGLIPPALGLMRVHLMGAVALPLAIGLLV
ncbi:MAG: tripartite tricarboxylate transporter permease [Thermoplasmata archaeon]|nr:tripartite tricarboxylate transporter permease [Thermoplasmata archaeon]